MRPLSRNTWTLLAFVFANGAYADDGDKRDGARRGPPPVAFEACSAAVDGDSCQFDGRRGESLSGTCVVAKEEALVCRPEGAPPRLRRKDIDDEEHALQDE